MNLHRKSCKEKMMMMMLSLGKKMKKKQQKQKTNARRDAIDDAPGTVPPASETTTWPGTSTKTCAETRATKSNDRDQRFAPSTDEVLETRNTKTTTMHFSFHLHSPLHCHLYGQWELSHPDCWSGLVVCHSILRGFCRRCCCSHHPLLWHDRQLKTVLG